jgi:hypothetical protein
VNLLRIKAVLKDLLERGSKVMTCAGELWPEGEGVLLERDGLGLRLDDLRGL